MHFGENQLSQSLIGLSPLTTGHPLHFQLKWVRASTRSYTCFTLPMARSLRFGSRTRDWDALFGLAFATATPPGLTSPRTANSQAHSSKGTPSPRKALTACKHMVSGTISLPSRGTFHHSLTVLSAIGHQGVFSLTRWSWQIHTGLHESRPTREPSHTTSTRFVYGTLTHSGQASQPVRLRTQQPCPRNAALRRIAPQHRTCNTCTLDTHTV